VERLFVRAPAQLDFGGVLADGAGDHRPALASERRIEHVPAAVMHAEPAPESLAQQLAARQMRVAAQRRQVFGQRAGPILAAGTQPQGNGRLFGMGRGGKQQKGGNRNCAHDGLAVTQGTRAN